MPKQDKNVADYILPLYMNGLEGRMLHLPANRASSKREILFLYGQHSSLERCWGLSLELAKYGTITMPDLPGMGGMDRLYKIGRTASLDNLADYLAAFIKLRYRHKKITIIGMSLGFVVATRMLQRYPHLTKKVDMVVSVVGFGHHDDFIFSRKRQFIYKITTKFFSFRLPSAFFHQIIIHPFFVRTFYRRTFNAKKKFAKVDPEDIKKMLDVEVNLWKINDTRTQMQTYVDMFKLDNTRVRIDLPVVHVATKQDQYFDNNRVEQHLRMTYSDFQMFYIQHDNHAPTIIADAKTAAPFIPTGLRRLLSKKPN